MPVSEQKINLKYFYLAQDHDICEHGNQVLFKINLRKLQHFFTYQ